METLYKAIVDTFNNNPQVFADRNLPAPRTIDIYMGQPDDPEGWEVFEPALFIGWSIQPQSNNDPDLLTLEVHLVQDPGTGTESFCERLDDGVEYLRMIKAVKYVLNKLRADNTTPLKWAGERPGTSPFYRYHIITYTCTIDGNSESLSRDTLTNVTLTDLDGRNGTIVKKVTSTLPNPVIDVFGK